MSSNGTASRPLTPLAVPLLLKPLKLLQELTTTDGAPTLVELRDACEAIFTTRASDASHLGQEPRTWPCVVVAHPHWAINYARAATSAGVAVPLDDGVTTVNAWVSQIAAAQ